MLVLTRKLNEGIKIRVGNDEIEIKVVEIRAGRVRLGVQAAKEICIRRGELTEYVAVSPWVKK
jgi:carbon storage regulator CsrA